MYLLWFLKGERQVILSGASLPGTAQTALLSLRLTLSLLFACFTLGMGSAYAAEAKSFKDCPDCPEMVVIPAGSFTMGSRSLEAGHHDNETPIHKVKVASFAMSKTHVTVEQFSRFVKETGYDGGKDCYQFGARKSGSWSDPGFKQMPNHPVTCVSWNDAKAYTNWLAHKTGKSYRLPSEAEWEYAARAGTTTIYYWAMT
ncbi:MAG: SUMF1/EgtB/PvdO family nonheme iron enzyme [Nitrosomonadales bacterium]